MRIMIFQYNKQYHLYRQRMQKQVRREVLFWMFPLIFLKQRNGPKKLSDDNPSTLTSLRTKSPFPRFVKRVRRDSTVFRSAFKSRLTKKILLSIDYPHKWNPALTYKVIRVPWCITQDLKSLSKRRVASGAKRM